MILCKNTLTTKRPLILPRFNDEEVTMMILEGEMRKEKSE